MMRCARRMQDKCMNARIHSIRYADFKYALVYHHKRVNKREKAVGVGRHAQRTHTYYTLAITRRVQINITVRLINTLIITEFLIY